MIGGAVVVGAETVYQCPYVRQSGENGQLAPPRKLADRVAFLNKASGGIASPFDSYMVLEGCCGYYLISNFEPSTSICL